MTYRESAGARRADTPTLIRSNDELSVSKLWAVAVFFVFGVAACWGARSIAGLVVGLLAAAAWIVIDSNTRRFEFTVERDAIVVRSKLFGLITAHTHRFDLADHLSFSAFADEYELPGFCLQSSKHHDSKQLRSVQFGSARDVAKSEALLQQMHAMIAQARAERAALDTDREKDPALGELAWAWPAVDLSSVERNAWGRVRSLRLAAPLEHPLLGTIGAASTLHFTTDDEYRSRAVPDKLTGVTFANATDTLYALAGLHQPRQRSLPGAVFRFVGAQWIELESAFDSATLDGIAIDGMRRIQAGNRVVTACSTAAPLVVHGHTYRAGTEFAVNGEQEIVATTHGPIEHNGKQISGRAHVHFQRAPGAERKPLGAILADPERCLTPPTRVHAI